MGQKPRCKLGKVTEEMSPFTLIQPAIAALTEAGLEGQAQELTSDVLMLRPKTLEGILETISKYVDLR